MRVATKWTGVDISIAHPIVFLGIAVLKQDSYKFYRAMLYVTQTVLSQCCLSDAGILSKQLYYYETFFTVRSHNILVFKRLTLL